MYNVEKRLDIADQHIKASDAKADQIKSLNRFFMLPSFGGKKVKKREEKLKKEQAEIDAKFNERNQEHLQQTERMRELATSRGESSRGRNYTTPQGLQRCEVEQEIDSNLDEISSGLARIRMMGQSMNQELSNQNHHIARVYEKTSTTDERLGRTNHKLNKIVR